MPDSNDSVPSSRLSCPYSRFLPASGWLYQGQKASRESFLQHEPFLRVVRTRICSPCHLMPARSPIQARPSGNAGK
ncbi:unnamed protein product [Protopolystoma xenopodis]|uniref:Uncharacterized protein n=1 Tax=Protopolystoma xenopodis TaxID=117903 RepID=A0A3S5AWK0_9PLAT|nr:unnamed protein product [Protopolystoma xenopodis]